MNKFSLFPVIAAVLCAALFLSCSSDPTDDVLSSSSGKSSSSSLNVSSSSSVKSSSSVENVSSSSAGGGGSSSSSVAVSSSSSTVTTNDPDLIKKTITLSYSGSSYADIDGDVAIYKQAEAKKILEKIDLIAYCGTGEGWCEGNSIYNPWVVEKLFWQNEFDFLGSNSVFFLEIPSEQAEVFKAATKRSEIISAYNSLQPIFNNVDNYLDEFPIVVGKVFFTVTSEENIHIVVIKAAGNQSVDLEVIQIPR